MSQEYHYIGVDVGTWSVRACLVKRDGTVLASSTQDTVTYRNPDDHRIFEQSTANIWAGVSTAIKSVLSESDVPAAAVKGLGFDATCSLAVTDLSGEPVVVTRGDNLGQLGAPDVILWADHRAGREAELISSTGSVVLEYTGGTMSVCEALSPTSDADADIFSWRWKSQRSFG
jgi:ribulose kinase